MHSTVIWFLPPFIVAAIAGSGVGTARGVADFGVADWLWTAAVALAAFSVGIATTGARGSPLGGASPASRVVRLVLICVSVVSAAVAVAYVIYQIEDAALKGAYAILFSATMATVGWIIQQNNTRSLHVKQYTLARIQEYRADKEYTLHRNNIRRYYPDENDMDSDIEFAKHYVFYKNKSNYVAQDGYDLSISHLPLVASVQEVMNFFEEMALAIRNDEMDEDVIFNTLGTLMIRSYDKFRPYIISTWREDFEVLEHYRWLINKWAWEIQSNARSDPRLFEWTFEAVAPSDWSNTVWTIDGALLTWETTGKGPWGAEAVDKHLRELAEPSAAGQPG